ncbi:MULTISPECIES: glycosyltransferase family 9 protein [Aphanothece]|uniref:glycosyltransferase family 9 protein n=1 Tax=Aphanothece TaxID=1121 RepID=UPI00398468E2
MRALFLIPGDSSLQLQAFPAVGAVADQLQAQVQIVCPPEAVPLWGLHPGVSRAVPFNFEAGTLADWANLLGTIREPDFQLCINRAGGRQVDLMLSMSHIPSRIASGGFSATERVKEPQGIWPCQAWEAWLQPIGVRLEAEVFRLTLPPAELRQAAAELPSGDGPVLLLAPAGGEGDWPQERWQELPGLIRRSLPNLRTLAGGTGTIREQAARMANADVVLASDPASIELAVLLGLPVVALGRASSALPSRQGVQALGRAGQLDGLTSAEVLSALGLA